MLELNRRWRHCKLSSVIKLNRNVRYRVHVFIKIKLTVVTVHAEIFWRKCIGTDVLTDLYQRTVANFKPWFSLKFSSDQHVDWRAFRFRITVEVFTVAVYLTTRGENPKEHGVKQELVSASFFSKAHHKPASFLVTNKHASHCGFWRHFRLAFWIAIIISSMDVSTFGIPSNISLTDLW